MSDITFTPEEKSILCTKLQAYCETELRFELGRFDAEFLLDFISKEFGSYYYNRGLYDAQAMLLKQNEELVHAIYQLEKPTEFTR
jgi:uncharacterized protein (DUF2164 family)